ncbi:MAG: glycosyltransferase family 2 protein [Betaproteobacteria bacterium]|nr:glycosyltransferase family 2 protein [Betaproteobacteria bacterium]MDE2057197.1 glycosyltransferase family 2 protein [Betaproteobacteria bacterium]
MIPTLSLIVPMHNEAGNIDTLYQRLANVLSPLSVSWEMICINDGSTDDTLNELLKAQRIYKEICIIDLTRNFGKEAALSAGLDFARGEAAIPIDADLQDPPEIIPQMIELWRKGFEVVLAKRKTRTGDSFVKRNTAQLFYSVINKLSEVDIPQDTGDFRLISRPVIDALKQLPERRRFMKGLFAWVGYKTAEIEYERPERFSGSTKFNYWKLWNFALEGITSFSDAPLKVASYLGIMISLLSFIYAIKIVIDTLLFGNPVKGYPSLIVAILFFSGVQLIALGIIGEYLGRIYAETKQRPIYLVRDIWPSEKPQQLKKMDD